MWGRQHSDTCQGTQEQPALTSCATPHTHKHLYPLHDRLVQRLACAALLGAAGPQEGQAQRGLGAGPGQRVLDQQGRDEGAGAVRQARKLFPPQVQLLETDAVVCCV